jgi:hypothetical protein
VLKQNLKLQLNLPTAVKTKELLWEEDSLIMEMSDVASLSTDFKQNDKCPLMEEQFFSMASEDGIGVLPKGIPCTEWAFMATGSSLEEMSKPIFACYRGKSFVIESDECVYVKILKDRISHAIRIADTEFYIVLQNGLKSMSDDASLSMYGLLKYNYVDVHEHLKGGNPQQPV